MNKKPKIIFIVGCTASGKGTVGRSLAEKYNGEILSIDSMKVYKLMDIGTAKPDAETRQKIPHHLIDIVDPSESFSAGKFVEASEQAIAQITNRNRLIFGIGGTVLYLKTLTEGLFEGPAADPAIRESILKTSNEKGPEFLHNELYKVDPESASRLHRNDTKRIIRALEVYQITGKPISSFQTQFGKLRDDYDMLFIGLRQQQEELNRRINERVRRMLNKGLVDEVKTLHERTPKMSPQASDAVGYAEIIDHFKGQQSLSDAIEKIKINTRRLAKTQRTWFRRMPHIKWFDIPPAEDPKITIGKVNEQIESWLKM